jgi:hypothetical protein
MPEAHSNASGRCTPAGSQGFVRDCTLELSIRKHPAVPLVLCTGHPLKTSGFGAGFVPAITCVVIKAIATINRVFISRAHQP